MEKKIIEQVVGIEITFNEGDKLPNHTVSSEVLACVVKGEIEFTVGREKFIKCAGEFMHIKPNVAHDLVGNVDSVVTVIRIGG